MGPGVGVERSWVVVLETARRPGSPAIGGTTLDALLDIMACGQIKFLGVRNRYAMQFRVTSQTPADALFVATARWAYGVRTLGLEGWELARMEVVTPEAFDRQLPAPAATESGRRRVGGPRRRGGAVARGLSRFAHRYGHVGVVPGPGAGDSE